MAGRTMACSESPRAAFTGAEAAERGEEHAPRPELHGGEMRFRTTRRRVAWGRRRCRGWSRKWPHVLYWGCFELVVCYVRHRGWRPIRLTQLGVTETEVWPVPAEVPTDEKKDCEPSAGAG